MTTPYDSELLDIGWPAKPTEVYTVPALRPEEPFCEVEMAAPPSSRQKLSLGALARRIEALEATLEVA